MKKPKSEPADTIATAVRLPRAAVDWLRQTEGGITGGIKRGLERLVFEEAFDAPTLRLAQDLMFLANDVERLTGTKWHVDTKAYEAFSEAIKTWLEAAKPPQVTGAAYDLFGPNDPQTLGRTIAKMRFTDRLAEGSRDWKNPFPSNSIYRGGKP